MNDSASASLAPRPAHVATEREHANQRRFGSDNLDAHQGTPSVDTCTTEDASFSMGRATLYRNGTRDHAELRLDIGCGWASQAHISLRLDPTGLRDLAARLLDAAHDIEANPADVLVKAFDQVEGTAT